MRKIFDNIKAVLSLIPAVYTADKPYSDGAVVGVDTQGYNDAMLVVACGNLTTVDETYVVKVFECDTLGGTYTDTGISAAVTADNTVAVARVSELNVARKRFLKATLDVGGSNPSFPGTAVILLGASYAGPVNSD